jgi:hypothetical protein
VTGGDKKVRPTARPDAKTLEEPIPAPTVPDGAAAVAAQERKRKRAEGVPLAPLDIDETPRRKR